MTFLRILSTLGLSISLGILIWLAISGALYGVLDNWTGWPPLSPGEPSQHIMAALMIGALNGLLVSIGLIFMLHKGSFCWAIVASFVATEVGLLLAYVLLLAFVDNGWKPPDHWLSSARKVLAALSLSASHHPAPL